MEEIIYIYLSLDKDYYVGNLYTEKRNGKELVSFEYADDFFKSPYAFVPLDPELSFYRGRQYCSKKMFGFLSDSCPDRWGRILLKRKELENAKKDGRKPNNLSETDYLMGVYDSSRMGALRFKKNKEGPFLSDDGENSIPPWVFLRTLEKYASDFEYDETIDDMWVKNLLIPGSSLGGARPKANVYSPDGIIWIAKFPSKKDTYDVGAWEAVANELASLCGLNVPDFKLEKYSNYGSIFLSKRFDRTKNERIHFQSAMTALNAKDGDSENYSYLDIASFIKANSAHPIEDLLELYKRVIFNMAINNTDDHLRNHGFLLEGSNFKLSPLYDINPTPYGNNLSLTIDEYSSMIDSELIIKTASYYSISESDAINIYNRIVETVKENWMNIAIKYGISRKSISDMEPAFSLNPIIK